MQVPEVFPDRTTNTYASSRLMLEAAGLADSFEEINSKAIFAARFARKGKNKSAKPLTNISQLLTIVLHPTIY